MMLPGNIHGQEHLQVKAEADVALGVVLRPTSYILHPSFYRNFANVVHMVEQSAGRIPKSLVIMFFHHALLEAFNYLLYLLLQPL